MKRFLLFLSFALAEFSAFAQKPYTTVVEGTVVDRPYSKTLLLSKAGEDLRIHAPREISVRDGKFSFSFETAQPEAYELTFEDEYQNGGWHPILFFPGIRNSDTIRMLLYPMDSASRNTVSGGPYNREFQYQDSLFNWESPVYNAWASLQEARRKTGTFYNAEARTLLDQLDREQDRNAADSLLSIWFAMQDARRHMTPEANATDRQMRTYLDSVQNARYEYIRSHPSLPGYYWLYRKQLFGTAGTQPLREEIYRTVYAPLYPNHPYTAKLDTLLYRQIRIGKRFADFTAPDLDGRMHTLAEQVKEKIAVINLWASWCGPCRRHGIALIPVYNEFEDKGFTIVGIAREAENADAMRKAIDKDGYPWLNLLELDDRAGIWKLYGVSNAGGSLFLIDRDGTVLAINPSAAEVRQILSEKLR